jgi:general secretion pathway protein H
MACREAKGTIVTLAVGSDSRGFSLLELTLVLLLLGLSSLIVLPNIERGLKDREVRGSALALAAVARDLRSRAVEDGIPQRLVLRLQQNSYTAAPDREVQLPPDVRFAEVEGGEIVSDDRRTFLFFPNGSSIGGTIVLSGGGAGLYSVRLEPLTGRIQVSRGEPL